MGRRFNRPILLAKLTSRPTVDHGKAADCKAARFLDGRPSNFSTFTAAGDHEARTPGAGSLMTASSRTIPTRTAALIGTLPETVSRPLLR
jgi:hypothetical protein